MIGLSVSLCIRDIANGKVNIEDIDQIIGGTACRTPEDWACLIDQYYKTYWYGIEGLAVGILAILIRDGKIYQPRLHGEYAPTISKGIWVGDTFSLAKERKCQICLNLLRNEKCSIEREMELYPEDYRQPLVPTLNPETTPYQLGCFYFQKK